jgi:hypothetical protein
MLAQTIYGILRSKPYRLVKLAVMVINIVLITTYDPVGNIYVMKLFSYSSFVYSSSYIPIPINFSLFIDLYD